MSVMDYSIGIILIIAVIYFICEVHVLRGMVNQNAQKLSEQQKLLTKLQRQIANETNNHEVIAVNSALVDVPELAPAQVNTTNAEDFTYVPNWFDKLFAWAKEDWLLKLGALFIILGFAWFISYSILNGWISPLGRVALGFASGLLFSGFGYYRIKKYLLQGGVFIALGATIILITIYIAQNIYAFINPTISLFMMFLVAAYGAYLSIQYKTKSLALLSIILAYIAPELIHNTEPNYYGLYTYLFVVTIATIWVAFITKYKELVLTSLIIVAVYMLGFTRGVNHNIPLIFANLFAIVYLLVNVSNIIKFAANDRIDGVIAVGNAIFLSMWIFFFLSSSLGSGILFIWTAIFAGVAGLFLYKDRNLDYFYVYSGISCLMLFMATTWFIHGTDILCIALAGEVLFITVVVYQITNNVKIAEKFSLLISLPAIMVLDAMDVLHWQNNVWHFDALAILQVAIILLLLAWFLYSKQNNDNKSIIHYAYLSVGTVDLYILFWLIVNALFAHSVVAISVLFVSYIIIGVWLYFRGINHANKFMQYYGGLLIGFVTLRLLCVEIWEMLLLGRILTVFLIGAVLISTAFYTKRIK